MPYLVPVILVALALIAVLFLGGKAMGEKPSGAPSDAGKPAVPKASPRADAGAPRSGTSATRAELSTRLKALAAAPRPPHRILSAECYEPPQEFHRAEYLCPKDATRTLYALDGNPPVGSGTLKFLAEELPAMRHQVAAMKGLDVSLDESPLCRKCSPKSESLEVSLVIRYPGEPPRVVRGVREETVQLLAEFLSGTDSHGLGGPDSEPLAEHAARIAQILGLDETSEKPTPDAGK